MCVKNDVDNDRRPLWTTVLTSRWRFIALALSDSLFVDVEHIHILSFFVPCLLVKVKS